MQMPALPALTDILLAGASIFHITVVHILHYFMLSQLVLMGCVQSAIYCKRTIQPSDSGIVMGDSSFSSDMSSSDSDILTVDPDIVTVHSDIVAEDSGLSHALPYHHV